MTFAQIRPYLMAGIVGLVAMAVAAWFFLFSGPSGPVTLTVAAGGQGGAAFRLLKEAESLAEQQDAPFRLAVIESGGSADNARRIAERSVDLAIAQSDTVIGPQARLVVFLYGETFQLIARPEAGITAVPDLAGKRLALPPEGSGSAGYFLSVAQHFALDPASIRITHGRVSEGLAALEKGDADAMFVTRATGDPEIRETVNRMTAAGTPPQFIAIPQAAALAIKSPNLRPGEVPQGAYRGSPAVPDADTTTIATDLVLVAHDRVDAQAIEHLTRFLVERRADLALRFPIAAQIQEPDPKEYLAFPLHPGTEQFVRREEPPLIQKYTDQIGLALTVAAMIVSGLLTMRASLDEGRKRRLDTYTKDLIDLQTRARGAKTADELRACRFELERILAQALSDLDAGKVSDQGFHVFSMAWQAVADTIADARAQIAA